MSGRYVRFKCRTYKLEETDKKGNKKKNTCRGQSEALHDSERGIALLCPECFDRYEADVFEELKEKKWS